MASLPPMYLCFALTVWLGRRVRDRRGSSRIATVAVVSALLFFGINNLTVWCRGHLYPVTAEGLLACYVAAVPFLQNMLLGNALFCTLLFGCFALAERRFPVLRVDPNSATPA